MDRPDEGAGTSVGPGARPSRAVWLAVVLVAMEALALGIAVVVLLVDVVTLTPSSLASAIALIVLTAVAAAWVSWIAVSLRRGAPWARGGAVFWQLVQLAVALGAIQGSFAQPLIGAAIAAPSILVLVLMCTRSVMLHTKRPDPEP
ncbi:hypothetical protein CLV49_2470 [Labedella gwakjiensis]|uniref:Uncharacterized protein n=1 Tax=Labedella gwakjiensis TaxID=390269 RepID=A0A2P8GY19_9MICO|nr:hypothetical protein [Labedella gwakjiensis]PSL38841.1 hypothetical protein CLV49_2470 [Labedella gwakjiensis]RUQ86690.1 hypothetical protein ELQ93_06880 [Labedella gwakjiensis]